MLTYLQSISLIPVNTTHNTGTYGFRFSSNSLTFLTYGGRLQKQIGRKEVHEANKSDQWGETDQEKQIEPKKPFEQRKQSDQKLTLNGEGGRRCLQGWLRTTTNGKWEWCRSEWEKGHIFFWEKKWDVQWVRVNWLG